MAPPDKVKERVAKRLKRVLWNGICGVFMMYWEGEDKVIKR
jgi:hypothetical protein